MAARPKKWEVDARREICFVGRRKRNPCKRRVRPLRYGTAASRSRRSNLRWGRWQGGAALPAAHSGKAVLTTTAVSQAEQRNQAGNRRVGESSFGKAQHSKGTLRHTQPPVPFGDGVRGALYRVFMVSLLPGPQWIEAPRLN